MTLSVTFLQSGVLGVAALVGTKNSVFTLVFLERGGMDFSCRVLLVEDSPLNQEVGRAMLENFGCRVEVASNGLEALRLVESNRYDLVFMDCQMPEMDGWEATRRIREFEEGKYRTPVIAMTAYMLDEEIKRCRDAGMDDYLGKPFGLRDLSGILERWITPGKKEDMPQGCGVQQAEADAKRVSAEQQPPSLDPEALNNLRRVLGPAALGAIPTMIDFYFSDSRALLKEMRRALDSNDQETLWRAAHTLKSSSANLGANVLSGFCREVEELARSQSTMGAEGIITRIEAEFRMVEQVLMDLLNKGE